MKMNRILFLWIGVTWTQTFSSASSVRVNGVAAAVSPEFTIATGNQELLWPRSSETWLYPGRTHDRRSHHRRSRRARHLRRAKVHRQRQDCRSTHGARANCKGRIRRLQPRGHVGNRIDPRYCGWPIERPVPYGYAPVPADPSSIKGQKYQSAPTDWNNPGDSTLKGWTCLKFSLQDPQYYMYTYASADLTHFSAMANGDLNGDLVLSTFTLLGQIQGGVLNIAPTIGEVAPDE